MIDAESITCQGGIIGSGNQIGCTLCVCCLSEDQPGQQGAAHDSLADDRNVDFAHLKKDIGWQSL
jgi:hypothetical protein